MPSSRRKKRSRPAAPLNRAGRIYVGSLIVLPLLGVPIVAYLLLQPKPAASIAGRIANIQAAMLAAYQSQGTAMIAFPSIILTALVAYIAIAIYSARRDPRFTTGTFTAGDAAKWLGRGLAQAGLTIVLDGLLGGSGGSRSSSSSTGSGMSGGGGSFGGGGASGNW